MTAPEGHGRPPVPDDCPGCIDSSTPRIATPGEALPKIREHTCGLPQKPLDLMSDDDRERMNDALQRMARIRHRAEAIAASIPVGGSDPPKVHPPAGQSQVTVPDEAVETACWVRAVSELGCEWTDLTAGQRDHIRDAVRAELTAAAPLLLAAELEQLADEWDRDERMHDLPPARPGWYAGLLRSEAVGLRGGQP